MKTKLIISAVLAATLFLNPISFAETSKNASATPPCKSCRKAAVAGKKNSRIESSQKTGSVLFDGVDPNLPVKDFAPDSSNPAALTGGGLLLDLKAAEPELGKVGPLTDFSLDTPATLVFAKTALLAQPADAATFVCIPEKIDPKKCDYTNDLERLNTGINLTKKVYENSVANLKACRQVLKDCSTWETAIANAEKELKCLQDQQAAYNAAAVACEAKKQTWLDKAKKAAGIYLEDLKTVGNWIGEKAGEAGDWAKEKIENTKNFFESLFSGEGNLPGRKLGREYLRKAEGNAESALKLAMQARDARNWESLTPEGAQLRNAENYLTAYWAVSKGQFLHPGITWLAYTIIGTPGWQAVHLLGEAANWGGRLFGIEFNFFPNDPASWDALFAGWAGATDALTDRKK